MPIEKMFTKFTNLYELQKTLKFELKPTIETKSLIEAVKKDKEIARLCDEEMKPLFNALHERFITESLRKVDFSVSHLKQLEKYIDELKKLRQNLKGPNKNKEKNKKAIKSLREKINDLENDKSGKISTLQGNLRRDVVKQFNDLGERWKDKYNGIETNLVDKKKNKIRIGLKGKGVDILKEENILALLANFYPEKVDTIQKFKGFFTYFSGFNKNRENYYSSDKKATGIANRIININLSVFIKNKSDFNLFLQKLPQLKEYRKYFEFEHFKDCLNQDGIEDYNEKVGEVKKTVNLEHNQKIKDKKDILKGLNKLQKQIGCKTKKQREQIKEGKSDCPEYLERVGLGYHIVRDNNDKYQIWECLDYINKLLEPKIKILRENYKNFFENDKWRECNLNEIWFRKEAINTISAKWFGGSNWFVLGKALAYCGVGKIDKKTDEYKVPPFISLQEIREAMEALEGGIDFDIKKSKKQIEKDFSAQENLNSKKEKEYSYRPENLFKKEYENAYNGKNLFEAFLGVWYYEIKFKLEETIDGYIKDGNKVKSFLDNFKEKSKQPFDKNSKNHKEIVFNLIQKGYLPLLQLSKYHDLRKKGEIAPGYAIDSKFYDVLEEFWEDNPINQYRTAFQATLTKKPYNENKIKLNFENPSLAKGWDINKEGERKSVIFRKLLADKSQFGDKQYSYYLAVADKNKEHLFDKNKNSALYQATAGDWEKMEYDFWPAASKMIPKCSTQLNPVIEHFGKSKGDFIFPSGYKVASGEKFIEECKISKEIFELNNRVYKKDNILVGKMRYELSEEEGKGYIKKFQKEYLELSKNKKEYKEALKKWIDFCRYFLSKYPKSRLFDYLFDNTEAYKSVDEFYKNVDRFSYMKKFVLINHNELQNLVKNGKVYLFQIYNKDFSAEKSPDKIGRDSLETLVVRNLFSERNLNERIIKLNGEAELFYRDKSIEKKKDKKRSKTFDIFTSRRYTEEKYFFHFPLTINFGTGDIKQKDFNQKVRCLLENQKTVNIIGIDRGEKNLLYYSLISLDKNGDVKIKEQGSLNRIKTKKEVDERKLECEYNQKGELSRAELVNTGKKVKYVDYHLLLDYYEKKRILARKSWQTIGKIKDLKDGYLSQVVYELYRLILKYNAVLAMENLNTEFKAKRRAMVEKSIYKKFELALAKKLNHLILKDKKPSELGGVLRPYQLTPKIELGRIDAFEKASQWGILFYVPPYYTSTTDPLTGWRKHKYIANSATIGSIRKFFDPTRGEVKIDFDQNEKCLKFSYNYEGKNWELSAYRGLQRFYWNKDKREMKIYDLHDEFRKLFKNLDKSKNINRQLYENDFKEWKRLVFLWNLLNQIRNTDRDKKGDANDFLQSPVWSEKYNQFFDSRKNCDGTLPVNGDANGAYNIARKGLIILKKIKKNPEKPDLSVSNQEWDEFAQK